MPSVLLWRKGSIRHAACTQPGARVANENVNAREGEIDGSFNSIPFPRSWEPMFTGALSNKSLTLSQAKGTSLPCRWRHHVNKQAQNGRECRGTFQSRTVVSVNRWRPLSLKRIRRRRTGASNVWADVYRDGHRCRRRVIWRGEPTRMAPRPMDDVRETTAGSARRPRRGPGRHFLRDRA